MIRSLFNQKMYSNIHLMGGYIQLNNGVSFHCYADDTQLYISSRSGETHQIEKLTECVVYIKNWMTSNFLLLNSEKQRC